jgi:hypothetical protein
MASRGRLWEAPGQLPAPALQGTADLGRRAPKPPISSQGRKRASHRTEIVALQLRMLGTRPNGAAPKAKASEEVPFSRSHHTGEPRERCSRLDQNSSTFASPSPASGFICRMVRSEVVGTNLQYRSGPFEGIEIILPNLAPGRSESGLRMEIPVNN